MSNARKQKGTSFESEVVTYLKPLFTQVERRALSGSLDKGDIAGLPVVIECKNHKELRLAEWVDQAHAEAKNAGVPVGVVWHKRRGKGNPADYYVTMTGADFVHLLQQGASP